MVEVPKTQRSQEWSRAAEKEFASIDGGDSVGVHGFRPTAEYGAMQLCRKAATTSGHREWHTRLRDHRKAGERRLMGKQADNYRASKKLHDDSARQQDNISDRARNNMIEACSHEDGRERRERHYLQKASLMERGVVDGREMMRDQTEQRWETCHEKQNAILREAAQVERALAQGKEKKIKELARHKTPAALSSPHTPRQALTRQALAALTSTKAADASPQSATTPNGGRGSPASGKGTPNNTGNSWHSGKRSG